MNRSRLEQETIILFNEAEDTAEITTYNGRLSRRMTELRERFPEQVQPIEGRGTTAFRFPKAWVKINPKRELSEEGRAQAIEVLAAYRSGQQS